MIREMKHYIYTCEADGSEAPLVMADGRIIEFESEARADAFLNALKNSSIFAEETEEFQEFTNIAYVKSAIVYCDDGYIDADAAEIEIFGKILEHRKNMTEIFEDVFTHYYFDDTHGCITLDGCDIYEDYEIWEAAIKLFEENGYDATEYNCELVLVTETHIEASYVLAIAWMQDGKLNTYNVPVYTEW